MQAARVWEDGRERWQDYWRCHNGGWHARSTDQAGGQADAFRGTCWTRWSNVAATHAGCSKENTDDGWWGVCYLIDAQLKGTHGQANRTPNSPRSRRTISSLSSFRVDTDVDGTITPNRRVRSPPPQS
jgi:hypothetical protein